MLLNFIVHEVDEKREGTLTKERASKNTEDGDNEPNSAVDNGHKKIRGKINMSFFGYSQS